MEKEINGRSKNIKSKCLLNSLVIKIFKKKSNYTLFFRDTK